MSRSAAACKSTYLSTVRALDRILVFDRGAVVEEGTHLSLLGRDGPYRRLSEIQDGGASIA